MNGDQVRDTRFHPTGNAGYRARDVDELLGRVVAELDAGRPVGQLIKNATLRKPVWTRDVVYDADAVDWFLGQFLFPPDQAELAGTSDDPWRDLPVGQLTLGEKASSEKAWRDFGQLPGTRLWWGEAGRFLTELRTAEQQTLASVRRSFLSGYLGGTVSTGGRSFIYERRSVQDRTEPDPETWGRRSGAVRRRYRLVDETGTPILYESYRGNFNTRAPACIKFPDQRWLRFLVRGRGPARAIMTAADQAGNRVVRYRFIDKDSGSLRTAVLGLPKPVEIIVHPGWKLTDELTLALAISGKWLNSYFESPGGGG
jgi:DivIVA domain-containing protein